MNSSFNTFVRCLMINPNTEMHIININFIENINKKLIPIYNIFENIYDTMNINYGCKFIKREIVAAYYPNNSYYSIFYQSDCDTEETPYNKIASIITNDKCYGYAYVVHFDRFNQLYDTDEYTFIESYNNMRTTCIQIKNNKHIKNDTNNKLAKKSQKCSIL